MFRSIRWRLVASYVFLTLLTVGAVGVLALLLVRRFMEQRELGDLTANAGAIARQAVPLLRPVARPFELNQLARTASFLGSVRVRILDHQHGLLADSGLPAEENAFVWAVNGQAPGISIIVLPSRQSPFLPPGDKRFVEPDAQLAAIVRLRPSLWSYRFQFEEVPAGGPGASQAIAAPPAGEASSRSAHVFTHPIGEAHHPLGYVELSAGPNFSADALATTGQAILLAGLGAAALAVVAGLRASRGLTAPLNDLAAAASRMSGGDLSVRAPVRGADEIGQLAGQFNQMAGRLEASFAQLAAERDALRRFIADASHELRTPLTALKTFNELLQEAAAADPAARAEFLAESQAQLNRLEWITRHLLDLSRLEAGLVPLEVGVHDIQDLLEGSVVPFKALANEKGVVLVVRPPESPAVLRCDRAQMEIALSNLLDNALKFTPPGGTVEVGGESAGGRARLWVRDDGPGIDPVDRPHLFERFYRGKNAPAAGSGLGLAIVQSIAQAHGGHVAVESEPGQGSWFMIETRTGPPTT